MVEGADKPKSQRPRNQEAHGVDNCCDKDKADVEQLDKAHGAAMMRNTARFKIEVNATKTDTYIEMQIATVKIVR